MSFYEYFRDYATSFIDWFQHDLTYQAHYHSSLEIIVCHEPTIQVVLNGVTNTLEVNDILVIHPMTTHYIKDEGEKNICIILPPSTISKYADLTKNKRPPYNFAIKGDLKLVNELTELKNNINNENDVAVLGYMNYILGKILSRMEFVPIDKYELKSLTGEIVTYIQEHFREKITLDILAKELSYNKYYLSQIINKNLDVSLTDYVNKIRLEYFFGHYNPEMSIESQICESGFKNRQSFYRIYKKFYGDNRLILPIEEKET